MLSVPCSEPGGAAGVGIFTPLTIGRIAGDPLGKQGHAGGIDCILCPLFGYQPRILAARFTAFRGQGFAVPGIGGGGGDDPDIVENGLIGQFALPSFLRAAMGG